MNFSLWYTPNVMVGRVGSLLHEHQRDPLKQLVTRHRGDCQVQEQPVQHRDGYVVEWTGDQVHGDTNQDVGYQVTDTCFSHLNNNVIGKMNLVSQKSKDSFEALSED